jgi:hypothetical protein
MFYLSFEVNVQLAVSWRNGPRLLVNSAAKNEIPLVQRIALPCTRKPSPADRPTMRDVANLLKNLSERMGMRNG